MTRESHARHRSRANIPSVSRLLLMTFSAIVVFAMAAWLTTCSRQRDPQAAFERARQAFRRGDMTAAQHEAEKGYRDFSEINAEWSWKFAILRARVMSWKGMSEKVLEIFASEKQPPPSADLMVQKDRIEAMSYLASGRFPEAERSLLEAERLCLSSSNPACGDLPTARGVVEMARGHYGPARILFQTALASARAGGDPFLEATALLNLSWSADEETHFDEALDWADGARQISVNNRYDDIAQTALGNMGWAYYKLGDVDKAEAMFIESGRQAEKLSDIPDHARWLQTLGYVYLDAGRITDAQNCYEQSLELARQIKSREHIVNSLIALAFVSEESEEFDGAKKYADEALSMARAGGNKRDEVYPRLVQGRVAAQQHDPAGAESAFREVASSPDAPVFLKWQAQHSLARLFEGEKQLDAADREYQNALTTFEAARKDLRKMDSRLPFLNNATAIYDDYIRFLVSQGKADEALRVADYSRARTLSEGLGLITQEGSFKPYPLNARDTARRAGGTVFFYWLGQKQSYLWVITPRRTALFTLPPEPEVKAAVQRYRSVLLGPEGTFEGSSGDGAALYQMLIAPAQEMLPASFARVHASAGSAQGVSPRSRDLGHPVVGQSLDRPPQVFIVPDGSLNSLNFETLLVPGAEPHYWIEDVTISNANSLRLLGASRTNRSPAPADLLLLGDAVAPSADYPVLAEAALEMQSIQKRFPPARERILAQKQATPPAYIESKPEQFSYIHFVAHGTASRLSPLESAIVLSKANDQDDSFKLYARDIIRHKLRADLVTISACYGAGTRAYSGEGLVGLSWAFLGAGAHNVIGALWEVSDVSTPQLMDEMYGELRKGKSPALALRAAKLSLLHSSNAFRKPFYWAPFQLYTGL